LAGHVSTAWNELILLNFDKKGTRLKRGRKKKIPAHSLEMPRFDKHKKHETLYFICICIDV
jgi:hypothetical protein